MNSQQLNEAWQRLAETPWIETLCERPENDELDALRSVAFTAIEEALGLPEDAPGFAEEAKTAEEAIAAFNACLATTKLDF